MLYKLKLTDVTVVSSAANRKRMHELQVAACISWYVCAH